MAPPGATVGSMTNQPAETTPATPSPLPAGTPVQVLRDFDTDCSGVISVPRLTLGTIVGSYDVWGTAVYYVNFPNRPCPFNYDGRPNGTWRLTRDEFEVVTEPQVGDHVVILYDGFKVSPNPDGLEGTIRGIDTNHSYWVKVPKLPNPRFDAGYWPLGREMFRVIADTDWLDLLVADDDSVSETEEILNDPETTPTIAEGESESELTRPIPTPKIFMHFSNLTTEEVDAVIEIASDALNDLFGEPTRQELRRDVDSYDLSLRWE